MTNAVKREALWEAAKGPWDVLVVGGGITGAAILREAARGGLKALLVEQKDFAWGTSSRSSKLVHGGLRYLKEGRLGLTRESVKEREKLLREGHGLVDPLDFLFTVYRGDRPPAPFVAFGLSLYDLFGDGPPHERLSAEKMLAAAPSLERDGLNGGFRYRDAKTDDARLVLRVLSEARAAGGEALNYARAASLMTAASRAVGVVLEDVESGRSVEARAAVVVNATGAFADALRRDVGAPPRMRPLRGSHLVFPKEKLPAGDAITLVHPRDGRPVFVIPWEGATILGTTDVDHGEPLADEPRMSEVETAYLMEALATRCPSLKLSTRDAVASYSGVRPVIGTGKKNPSEESRDHVVWDEKGLLTVTGGKLTTFRKIACDALEAIRHRVPLRAKGVEKSALVEAAVPNPLDSLPFGALVRLAGRYGAAAPALLSAAKKDDLSPIGSTPFLWAELRWAAREEAVVHLEDLLLRRVRVGLVAPEGGAEHLPRVKAICEDELGWNAARFRQEEAAYRALWKTNYAPPGVA
ncbi:MAG TPA: glycerol-3-phosphate dehydrogenase/oxidase [Thermoanaerobaculia bacterium]|nr:glycerol-3-phosphate dehydrogenase/oxidase [Thermoanaerobaculia bacterium]